MRIYLFFLWKNLFFEEEKKGISVEWKEFLQSKNEKKNKLSKNVLILNRLTTLCKFFSL